MKIKLRRVEIASFIADESGQDVVEYALLAALVGIASIATWKVVANNVAAAYSATGTNVQNLAPPPNPTPPAPPK